MGETFKEKRTLCAKAEGMVSHGGDHKHFGIGWYTGYMWVTERGRGCRNGQSDQEAACR
jgi:hypothetical protein